MFYLITYSDLTVVRMLELSNAEYEQSLKNECKIIRVDDYSCIQTLEPSENIYPIDVHKQSWVDLEY